jgi:hypothetical protein
MHTHTTDPADTSALWRRRAPALAFLALTTLIFFWPVVLGRGWIPRGGGDSVSFIYPMYRFIAHSLWQGEIPLWNPHQYAGAPFIADNQSGIFYPFNLLLFLLWPNFDYRAIEWLVIGHFFLAGAAMYACLRGLLPHAPLRRPAAVAGALAFMFSDLFITHVGNLNLIAVAAWLPLTFLALHRALIAAQPRARAAWAIAGGALLGVATLAGHGQMTFMLAALLGVYALYRTAAYRAGRALPLLGLLGLVAIGGAAVTLFPAAAGVQHTVRAGFDAVRAGAYALPWAGLTGLFAPGFFGRGSAAFWGDWARVEYGYAGVLPWLLAATAVFLRRTRLTLFFVLAGLLFLLLALGPNAPLYPLLLRLLPFFPFQAPARFVLLLNFCLAALAALGLDRLLRTPLSRAQQRALVGGGALVLLALVGALLWLYGQRVTAVPDRQAQMLTALATLAALGIAGLALLAASRRLPARTFAALAIVLIAGDLIGQGWRLEVDWNDPRPGFPTESPALAFLQADPGIHRIDLATGAWQPNAPQLNGLYAIGGVYNPLELTHYAVYIGAVGYRGSTPYNLLGVKYVIGGKEEPPADTTFIVPVLADDPDVTVYLNTRGLPRALVVPSAQIVAGHEAAFSALHAADFDPTQTVILETGRPLTQPPGRSAITIVRYDLNTAVFEVTTDQPAYFVLSDIYHPDWRAMVNGAPAPILRANYALRALYLEPGTSRIEMWFAPAGWRPGWILSSLTLLALLMYAIWIRRAGRTAKAEPPDLAPSF